MILTVTAPNGHSVDVDTEENPHTCIIDGSFTCIACVAQSLVSQSDKAPAELLTDANLVAATWRVSKAQDDTWSVFHGDEYITGKWSTRRVAYRDLLSRVRSTGSTTDHGNRVRENGVDRCPCGCKYWENDRCIDCGNTEPEENP